MNRTRSNRRILLLCTLLVCLVSMLMIRFSAAAEENVIPETRQLPRLVDRADLLSELEEEELEARLDEISERQQADVVVVTVNSLDGKSAQDYADDFYDYNGYGIGTDKSGILLLVSMEARDWHITTTGFGIRAITDAGLDYISDQFLPYLSDGEYLDAFETYADLCDEFLRVDRRERQVENTLDGDSQTDDQEDQDREHPGPTAFEELLHHHVVHRLASDRGFGVDIGDGRRFGNGCLLGCSCLLGCGSFVCVVLSEGINSAKREHGH